MTSEEKRKWWTMREQLDQRLGKLLESAERCMFENVPDILLGQPTVLHLPTRILDSKKLSRRFHFILFIYFLKYFYFYFWVRYRIGASEIVKPTERRNTHFSDLCIIMKSKRMHAKHSNTKTNNIF
eukprot:c19328_g1_i1.p1 GENE.c19328_g1_i1~~c19328_g1_i1.p1  ORF type:complete len:126 (+),score=17.77 c19328_g1_i1:173-550(+)